MTIKSKICRLLIFTACLVMTSGIATVIAQEKEDLLDGKVFVGQSREKHKRSVKDDELRFVNGEFYSVGYGKRGFSGGEYKVRTEDDRIYFEAETVSPKRGKIKWRGIVEGDSIEVNYHWSKRGWLSNTEKDYLFNGTLKR